MEKLNKLEKVLIILCIVSCAITIIVSMSTNKIVSTKTIEPYKVVLTKVDGKVVKTFHYKQN